MAEFLRGGTPVHGNALPVQSLQQMGPGQALYMPQGLGNGAPAAPGSMMPMPGRGGFQSGQNAEGLAALLQMYGLK